MTVETSGFDLQIDEEKIIDRAAPQIAAQIRTRAEAETGWELAKSIGYADGEIAPQGMRADSDTHKNRPPLSNRALAAMQAAKGRPLFEVLEEDERALAAAVEPLLFNGGL